MHGLRLMSQDKPSCHTFILQDWLSDQMSWKKNSGTLLHFKLSVVPPGFQKWQAIFFLEEGVPPGRCSCELYTFIPGWTVGQVGEETMTWGETPIPFSVVTVRMM